MYFVTRNSLVFEKNSQLNDERVKNSAAKTRKLKMYENLWPAVPWSDIRLLCDVPLLGGQSRFSNPKACLQAQLCRFILYRGEQHAQFEESVFRWEFHTI